MKSLSLISDVLLIMETIEELEEKEIEELDEYLNEYRQAHNIYMRLLAVRMVKLGETRTAVGEFIHRDRKTVGNWVKEYDEYGIEGLVRHDGSGAHLISEILLNIDFNPSCDGISSLETLNQAIGYEVA